MVYAITNTKETLVEAFKQIPNSYAIDILVGYCYFSGLRSILEDEELYRHFLSAPLLLLIGLEVDARFYREYSQYNNISEINDREYRNKIQEQLIQFCNNEHYRDKELLRLFFQKLNDGTLEIRKTRSPAHAKLYIFQTQEDTTKFQPGIVITGSSNLTQSGLSGQIEYNVVL